MKSKVRQPIQVIPVGHESKLYACIVVDAEGGIGNEAIGRFYFLLELCVDCPDCCLVPSFLMVFEFFNFFDC